MLNATQMPPRMFNLEGTLLGFLGSDDRKPKAIVLGVDDEQIAIKLPKELRASITRSVNLGHRLRCIGCSQIDFKAGVIKLRAYQVFFLPPADQVPTPPPAPPAFTQPEHAPACKRLVATTAGAPTKEQVRSHILVCHKSGCQKRGGRQMVSKLEQMLQEYQLQDQVEIRYTGCQKRCSKAPNLTVMPGKHRYDNLHPKDLSALIEEHFCPS